MSIKESEVITKWNGSNKKHYIEKGYQFTRIGESFVIKIKDITIGSTALITPICDICDHESSKMIKYTNYVRTLKRANNVFRCKECAKNFTCDKLTMDIEELKRRLMNIYDGKIKIIEDTYKKASERADFTCILCNNRWTTTPNNILSHETNCPDCARKNTTEMIAKRYLQRWLDFELYEFETQKTFKGLKQNKYPLRFDFSIRDINTNKILLIELQGEQHYRIVDFSGKKDESKLIKELEIIKKRDDIKREYVLNNHNLNLVYISYQKYNNIEVAIKELLINEGIKMTKEENVILEYDYDKKFELAEKIRYHKFILDNKITKKDLIKIYNIDETFQINKDSANTILFKILNGYIMYEGSRFKDQMDKFSDLSKYEKSAMCQRVSINKEIEENVCSLYLKGFSIFKINKTMNISHNIIKDILANNNIKIRNKQQFLCKTSILDEQQVKEIKILLLNNKVGYIAKMYNVNISVISKIKSNTTWKHIVI